MEIKVGCKLRYEMAEPTAFVFQIEAAKADSQTVKNESLTLPPVSASDLYVDPITLTRKVRTFLGPGPVEVVYEATVDVDASGFDPAQVSEFDFAQLPMEYLEYLAASRYCPSDIFTKLAFETFGKLPRGHTRVTAICDWIFRTITYASGSTSLCRALSIPARYASVYADALSPQDFHAVFQAYLNGPKGGEWFAFDASRMSSVDALVRIAAGRDAADVAFAWPQGVVTSQPPEVWADAPGRTHNLRTPLAVSN